MFDEEAERRERQIKASQARARSEDTRRTMLDLLRGGPMSKGDLQAELTGNASISVLNYHLKVLLDSRKIVSEDGRYRLA